MLTIPTATSPVANFGMPNAAGNSVSLTQSGSTGPGTLASASMDVAGVGSTGNLLQVSNGLNGAIQYYASTTSTSPGELAVSKVVDLTTNLTSSSYGLVAVPSGQGVAIGGFHEGTITPASQMPTVTGTYRGNFAGLEFSDPTRIKTISGTTDMTANFGAGTVQGSVSNLGVNGLTPLGYGMSLNGNIAGNTYTGTAGFTGGGGTVTSSALNGAFYGANANETAGAVALAGRTPTGTNAAISGAFGATRR